ncbi:MAG: adenylate/guanylate cyclase domain-containing protein [Bacteroidota bacterium]
MRTWIVISFFLFIPLFTAIAQQSTIDSLISKAGIIDEKDLYIDKLSTLQKAFNQAKDSKSDYRLMEICTKLGDLFFENKIYDSAVEYYKYVFTTDIDTIHKSDALINIYRRIGQSYAQLNEPDSALTYYEHIFDDFEFPEQLELYRDLVEIYRLNGNHGKSLKYNLLIQKKLEDHSAPKETFAKIYNNIGYNYHGLKDYRKAIFYFSLALNINSELTNEEQAAILSNLGICHFNLGNNERSIILLQRAYDTSVENSQKAEISHLLAEVFVAKQDYLRSLKFYKFSEEHAKIAESNGLLVDVYAGMSSVYNRTLEYDLAFEYFKNFSRLRDSLKFEEELNRKRLLDNQKFIERAEKENTLLKAQQDFQRLQIQQLETESRNQTLRNEALTADSVRVSNELALAQQKNELAAIAEERNELEIARQKNLIELTNQKLEIAKSNEEKALIESEKQQREIELAQEKINLQQRDAQLKSEKEANEKKQAELERGKVQQRNTLIITLLLALLAVFAGWAYRSKRKDNERLSEANEAINKAKNSLEEAETKIRKLLKQQVSGAVAEALITKGSKVTDEQQFVAIMFLDIRDFTVFCEGKKPSEIIAYQNSVFGFMINIIERHHGVVNQLMGDGFMATFGAPASVGNDCLNAFRAAREIIAELDHQVSSGSILPTKIGIGLHAGYVVTGNVGNEERKQFSITGNTVILAARLEQLNKQFGSSMVYSKELYDQLDEADKMNTAFKEVMVKGRSKPIKVTYI